MSKIVIDNVEFDFDNGCKLLKLKNGDECPFPQLEDFWNDIEPLTFKEIAQFENLEKRRIGINYLGLERLIESVKPRLVDAKTIKKTTSWVNENASLKPLISMIPMNFTRYQRITSMKVLMVGVVCVMMCTMLDAKTLQQIGNILFG